MTEPTSEEAADNSAPEPARASESDTAKPRKKRWRRRLLIAGGVLLLIVALLPSLAGPFLRGTVERVLSEQLEMKGQVGGLSLGWFSGVTLTDVDFRSDTQVIACQTATSDVSVADYLFSGKRWSVGDDLTIVGLRLTLDLREDASPTPPDPPAEETAPGTETQPPLLLRLPRIVLRDLEFQMRTDSGALNVVAGELGTWDTTHLTIDDGVLFEDPVALSCHADTADQGRGSHLQALATTATAATEQSPVRVRWTSGDGSTEFWSEGVKLDVQSDGQQLSAQLYAWPSRLRMGTTASDSTTSGDWLATHVLDVRTHSIPAGEFDKLGSLATGELIVHLLAQLEVLGSGAFEDTQLHSISANIVGDGSRCNGSFEGEINAGTINGKGTLFPERWKLQTRAHDVQTSRQLIDTLALISPFFVLAKQSPAQPRVLIGCDADFEGRFDAPQDSLTGTGTLRTSPGDLQIAEGWESLIALIEKERKGKPVLFRAMEQAFEISDGKILNRGFELATDQGSMLVEGYTTLSGELFHDLHVDKVLAKELGDKRDRPEYQILADALEQQSVKLRGSVSDPKLELPAVLTSPGSVIQEILKPGGAGQEAIKKGLDDLLQKGLDDLFKKEKKDRN
ncbi:MAG: hypothetical protein AAF581_23485 [Planctomycetota bacterium]